MSERRDYVLNVADRMWGDGAQIGRGGTTGDSRTNGPRFTVVPSATTPRLLLPTHARRASAEAIRGFGGHHVGSAKWRGILLALLFRFGAGDRIFRVRLSTAEADGIDTYLSSVFGRPLLVGMHVGPSRANRKPVLQLLEPAGAVLGFAKIGTDDLTGRLLRTEAAALSELSKAPSAGIDVPRLLHFERWRDLDILVQSPLHTSGTTSAGNAQLERAMVSLATSLPPQISTVDSSPFLLQLATQLEKLRDDGRQLASALRAVMAGCPDLPLATGRWHGDWTAYNCAAASSGRLLVWDWERFDRGVPLGFDALHHRLQTSLTGRRPAESDALALVDVAPELLAAFGADLAVARLTAVAYLAEIGRRYLQDDQAAKGGRGGQVSEWLVPAMNKVSRSADVQRGTS